MKSQIARFQFVLWLLPVVWLWFALINYLRVEWALNPQYAYGSAVPFMCLFLLGRNLLQPESKIPPRETPPPQYYIAGVYGILALLALLYLPTRLLQEAVPTWRLVGWALAVEVIGITLILIRIINRQPSYFYFVFPICYFFVAVPWPSIAEWPVINYLTQLDVSTTTELAGWGGVPAMAHGNVIEVATGQVDIDEACSGIRSFQATLMISLFLGEWLRLGLGRRMALVLSGFLLSLLFNLVRLTVLVWVAAHDGINAMNHWHDSTGVTILLGCFFGLWFLAHALAGKSLPPPVQAQKLQGWKWQLDVGSWQLGNVAPVIALATWILFVEMGVEGWYAWHMARLPAAVVWSVNLPTENSTYKELPIAPEQQRTLRYDEGRRSIWQADEQKWEVIYLRWRPGKAAIHLANYHTPKSCLTASGHEVDGGDKVVYLKVSDLQLPFRFYRLKDLASPVFVAYCLWDDRAVNRNFSAVPFTWNGRLASILGGQRNPGQRSIEIALTGANNLASAQVAIQNLLEKIISPIH